MTERTGDEMKILGEVHSWMNFIGWSDGGNPGSTKSDKGGQVIARHGDATWIADVEDAIDRAILRYGRAAWTILFARSRLSQQPPLISAERAPW